MYLTPAFLSKIGPFPRINYNTFKHSRGVSELRLFAQGSVFPTVSYANIAKSLHLTVYFEVMCAEACGAPVVQSIVLLIVLLFFQVELD